MDLHGNLLWRDQVANVDVRPRKWTSLSAMSSKLLVMVGFVPCRSVVCGFILGRLSVGCAAVVTLLGLEVMSSYSNRVILCLLICCPYPFLPQSW